jgi:predicted nuclease with TOPRIM domain
VALGYGIAYWVMHDTENIREKLQETKLENKELEIKLVGAQRELQVELATNNTLAKELASVQDENIKIKEDLFFYKNMVSKRAR